MNNISIVCRVATDPDLKTTNDGTPVCSFRVAIPRNHRNLGTDFITVVCWNATAKFAGNYLTTGRLISIVGRLQVKQWTRTITKKVNIGGKLHEVSIEVPMETPEIVVLDLRALDRPPQLGDTDGDFADERELALA